MNWVTVRRFTDYSKCAAVMAAVDSVGGGAVRVQEVDIWKPLYFLLSSAVKLTML